MTFKMFSQKKMVLVENYMSHFNTKRGAFEKGVSKAMQGLFTMK